MSGTDRDAALKGADVSRETLAKLDQVIATLDRWRLRSNLIGPREWDQIWSRHVMDCHQLRAHIASSARIVDLGSGAGFPGLVLAASAEAGGHVTMIESVGKKCAFLHAAIEAAELPATVIQGRVEANDSVHADIVTARAFAPMPRLLEYASPWLLNGAAGVFQKGARWTEELTQARETWDFSCEAIPSRSGGAGVILKISEVRRVG
ncbi:MAG: 16S rRNA (guanine(527)-N(7))-methyltransferase RsmG [Pseudomonadota bacterium]